MTPVTKPFLPPIEEIIDHLTGIYSRQQLTNNGPLVADLETKLKTYLDLRHLSVVGNGTLALQLAFKSLGLKGKIAVTPFSYIASVSSLVWEKMEPVFVDIEATSLNLDPNKVAEAMDLGVGGILATHVFGNPCEIGSFDEIGQENGIPIVYDASHAFGTRYKGRSVFEYGDLSTASFHATKLFHTVEGGAIFCRDQNQEYTINKMKNFGHEGFEDFSGLGINAKLSEFHAAMGLSVLPHMNEILTKRKHQYNRYRTNLDSPKFLFQKIHPDAEINYAYCPVVFPSNQLLSQAIGKLNKAEIFPRRYFYPALNHIKYIKDEFYRPCPIAESISERILCLPMYHDLRDDKIDQIIEILNED